MSENLKIILGRNKYCSYSEGSNIITLDDYFTIEELELIVEYMKTHLKKTKKTK